MATTSTTAENGKAFTVKKTFSRETSVGIDIKSHPSIIWALLTTAPDYPRWNPTVISIEGNIAAGSTIKLKSTLAPKRIFTLKIKEFNPENSLAWGDAMGNRVFTLSKKGTGPVGFSMVEKIGGPLFPLFAKMIPPFDAAFEQFAVALKKEAERIMNTK